MEYVGFAPQPLFRDGRPDGVTAILRTVIRPRAAYVARSAPSARGRARLPLGGQPPMVRMWVDRTASTGPWCRRVCPRRSATSIPTLQPRLHGVAVPTRSPTASTGITSAVGWRGGGTHVISPDARLGVVAASRPIPTTAVVASLNRSRRRDPGAAADLR
jgi:hypothetical protein